MGLHKIQFEDLRSGMFVSSENLKVYEVVMADRVQALMMKDDRTAVVMTKEEFEKYDWWTAVTRRKRRTRGKTKD